MIYSRKKRTFYVAWRASSSSAAADTERDVGQKIKTPLLYTVNDLADLRKLSPKQLHQLADELRAETIDAVSITGGHLGAGLGVVELTAGV